MKITALVHWQFTLEIQVMLEVWLAKIRLFVDQLHIFVGQTIPQSCPVTIPIWWLASFNIPIFGRSKAQNSWDRRLNARSVTPDMMAESSSDEEKACLFAFYILLHIIFLGIYHHNVKHWGYWGCSAYFPPRWRSNQENRGDLRRKSWFNEHLATDWQRNWWRTQQTGWTLKHQPRLPGICLNLKWLGEFWTNVRKEDLQEG